MKNENGTKRTRALSLDEVHVSSEVDREEQRTPGSLWLCSRSHEHQDETRLTDLSRAEWEYLLLCCGKLGLGETETDLDDLFFPGDDFGYIPRSNFSNRERAPSLDALRYGFPGDSSNRRLDDLLSRLTSASSQLPQDELLIEIVTQARELMEADAALLALVDEGDRSFTYRAVSGLRTLDCLGLSRPVEESCFLGWVIRQGTPLTSADARTDLRGGYDCCDTVQARSVAAVPLVAEGKICGALAVVAQTDVTTFPRRDTVNLLLPLARAVAPLLRRDETST